MPTTPAGLRSLTVDDTPAVLNAFVTGGKEMLRQGDVTTLAQAVHYCQRLVGQLAFVAELPGLSIAVPVVTSTASSSATVQTTRLHVRSRSRQDSCRRASSGRSSLWAGNASTSTPTRDCAPIRCPDPLDRLTGMIRRAVVTVLVGILAFLLPTLPAHAATGAPITKMHVDVQLDDEGTAQVTMDFTMDFSKRSGRGPVFQFFTTQEDGQDSSQQYVFDFSKPRVSSPTGAETDLHVDRGTNAVEWRIGDEDVTNHEPQDYRLEFTIEGMAWDHHPESGLAEFNWQVFSKTTSDISNFTATMSGPVSVEQAACFTGPGNRTACGSSVSGGKAQLSLPKIPYGQGVQIVAGFPAGTFHGATPHKRKVPTLASNFLPGPVPGAIVAVLSALAAGGTWIAGRRAKRDLVYLGLTPGTVPPRPGEAAVGLKDTSKIPVAVQFQPPKGASPGEIGTLIDATADGIDVSATLIDLAVRGYIRIEPGTRHGDFTLHALGRPLGDLEPFEQRLLEDLFRGAPTRTTQELRDERFHEVMSRARSGLYSSMVRRKWFVRNPKRRSSGWAAVGTVCLLLAAMLGYLLWVSSMAYVAIPLAVLGLGLLYLGSRPSRRTAEGSAVLQQARGFELYLRTAETNQIKFEEGIDVFSRYLPYAMIYGVAERWAKIFAELEHQGAYAANRDWIVGDYTGAWFYSSVASDFSGSFASSMSASAASYAAAQASSASSGGSGFSGGGGFGGGSVGSW